MATFATLLGCALASFLTALVAIAALRPLAGVVDLIDRPKGHKAHEGEVPVIGGLAMLLGLLVGVGVTPAEYQPGFSFAAACSILIIVGLVDDRFDISPWARLPVHAAAALFALKGAGLMVTQLGDPFGTGTVILEPVWSHALTLVLIMGAINAFNMLDGMDGLAGATALVGFGLFAFTSSADGLGAMTFLSLIGIGVVAAFLVFNVPALYNRSFRCFMGDAGSTLLGFVLAWLCIAVSQDPSSSLGSVAVLWFVAMPIYELVWTMLRRLSRGRSPFRPDREHFHHLLQSAGFSVRGAFGVYVTLCVLIGVTGLVLAEVFEVSDALMFGAFHLVGVGIVMLMYRASILRRFVPAGFLQAPSEG